MPDETFYDSIAQNVLNGKLYPEFIAIVGGTTPPGYSIPLSIAYLFSDDRDTVYHTMLIINSIITTSVIFPAYFILRKYCSAGLAISGSLAVATLPAFNFYPFTLMSENLFIPLFVYSMWFILESYSSDKKIWDILASFSVVYLYMTRSNGLAMIAAFVLAFIYYLYVNRNGGDLLRAVKKKWALIASLIVFLTLWLGYSAYMIPTEYYSFGSPYDPNFVATTVTNQSAATIDYPGIIADYLMTFLNEINFLLLSSYFFIVITIILFYSLVKKDKNLMDVPLRISGVYALFSSVGLFIVCILFIVPMNYEMYGRYIGPIIPLVFIFGFIGMEKMSPTFNNKKFIVSSIAVLITAFILMSTIPKYFDAAGNMTIYYLMNMDGYILALFSLALCVAVLFLFYVSSKYPKYVFILPAFMILISLIVTIPTYNMELKTSIKSMGTFNQLTDQGVTEDSIIMVDSENFNSIKRLWHYLVFYYGPDNVIINTTDKHTIEHYGSGVDYLISPKPLPYYGTQINFGTLFTNSRLYDINKNNTITVPYVIDVGGKDDTDVIDGFQYPEQNKYRWTKDSSKVIFYYPAEYGDANLTLATGGFRPEDDPARVELFINDTKIGEFVKYAGDYNHTIQVPAVYLEGDYHILEIRVNTWVPYEYGIKEDERLSYDDRELGITLDYIVIDR
ncbi:glycosyltransferase family 39 protein [Methanooceanicella nereidis]|nr:glycosyltransferase family 39 protein [Methanocella sp. CWC-04]